jgi:hypothetical protein
MNNRLFTTLVLTLALVSASFAGTSSETFLLSQNTALKSRSLLAAADTTKPVVMVITPSSVSMYSTYIIRWIATDASGIASRTVDFYNGSAWIPIGTSTVDTLRWNAPSAVGDSFQFRVTVVDSSPNANIGVGLSGRFRIDTCICIAPVVTISMPAKINKGSTFQMAWTESSPSSPIASRVLLFSQNNGTTYDTIAKPSSNLLVWNVPSIAIAQCRMRIVVTAATGRSGTGTSGQFAIVDPAAPIVQVTNTDITDFFGIWTMGKTVRLGVNAGAYSVKVYNLAGRLMMSRNAVASQGMYQSIPVTSSSALIVRLEQAGKMLTKKVMPQ